MAGVLLTTVPRTTLTADICRKLANHLIRGDWQAGDRLPSERELCQQLGVGRASLREALKALEIMGLIETRLGDGTYVCKRSEFFARPLLWAIASSGEAEAHELCEARKLIEVELAGLAAERSTTEEVKLIGSYLDQMEESGEDSRTFLQADIGFHIAIGQAAHNAILLNALLLIRNLMQRWVAGALTVPGVQDKALHQHKRIFLALAKRDSAKARSAMQTHLEEMSRHLGEVRHEARQSGEVESISVA
ncbi:MAG: FadR family transcriptional regulator [Bryobacteraceae bacterium]|nr:FadR family transcriptional regulator [Bryobacteraceae bacterium]